MIKDLDSGLEGRNVIIVEDIVDTGLTLAYLQEILHARDPTHAAHRLPAQQAVAAEDRREGRVHRLHDRGPLRGRLRPRLRREVPEPAVHRRAQRVDGRPPPGPSRASARASASTTALVERPHPPVAHQHPPVDDGGPHVVAARHVDQVRDRVVHRRLPRARSSTRRSGRRACPPRATRSSRPGRARAPRRSSPSRAPSCAGTARGSASPACAGTPPAASPRTCRGRCCSPRRRCRVPPSRPPPGTRGTGAVPLASFMLLSGLCDTVDAAALQDGRCPSSVSQTPCAASDVRAPGSRSTRGTPVGRQLVLLARRCATSSSVSARWIRIGTLVPVGQSPRRRRSVALVQRVHRVRRRRRRDQVVALELLDERLGPRQRLGRRLRVRHREPDDRLAQHAAQARRPRRPARSPPRSSTCRRTSSSPTGSSRAPPGACRRGPSPATRSSPPPGRCTAAASPSAPGRRRGRGTSPSARGCAC